MEVALVVLYELVKIMAMIHVLMDNRQPAKTMAWMLVIYFMPIIGLLFYFFFGLNTRRDRLMSERSLNQLTKRSMLEFVEQRDLLVPDEHRLTVDLFVNQNFCLPFKDNAVRIFTDGHSFFSDLLHAIGTARQSIHMDFYIFEDDPLGNLIADVLIDKAREGVEVKLIYDDVGCWKVKRRFFERMRQDGIEAWPFMPVRFRSFTSKVNYRNHRKIVVVDGKVGYIGGMNVALRYVKGIGGLPWRDTMVKIEGGGVYGLQRAFLVDWYFVDRTLINDHRYYPPMPWHIENDSLAQVVTSSPIGQWPDIMQGYVRILLEAKQYVYMETPYFLPTEPVLFAMRTAALAGVDVRLMIPRRSDAWLIQLASMSYVTETLEAGVKVRLYEKGFNHSKLLVADDRISTCGSTNIDFRSFENNFEANVFFYDRQTALRIKDIYMRDEACSINFSEASELHHRPYIHRFVESLLRLLSPLL